MNCNEEPDKDFILVLKGALVAPYEKETGQKYNLKSK